jgi:hypothetical protein
MIFSLFKKYGALNSKPVFEAFENSLIKAGYTVKENDMNSDVAVIWSVLWNGRMANNKTVWDHYRGKGKNVIVLEVGGIKRGTTWKVGLNGINSSAYYGSLGGKTPSDRSISLGLTVNNWRSKGEYILVAGQHNKSLQWQNQPDTSTWFTQTCNKIRKYSDRPILLRPHPRCKLPDIEHNFKNVYRQEPKPIPNTYDDFDISFDNVWATVNYSSNPGINSIVAGVPAFVSKNSLARPVGNNIADFSNIENPLMPDRTQWLNDYAWTEYTIEEIQQGIPLEKLTDQL